MEEFDEALAELNRQPKSDGNIPADLFFKRQVRGQTFKVIKEPNKCVEKMADNTDKKPNTSHEWQKLKMGEIVRVLNPRSKLWDETAKIIG